MTPFDRAVNFTLGRQIEGGYWSDPIGGNTNHGVTQDTYNTWRAVQGLPTQPVLQITHVEVLDIYQHMYWNPAKCDEMGDTLSVAHFDFAVNHGVEGAAKILQKTVGVTEDGNIGPDTLKAIEGTVGVVAKYLNAREVYYREIAMSNTLDAVVLPGWLNRVALLRAYLGLPT